MARILVIDDEDDVRAVIRAILESGGHEVETASDGVDGVRKFQQQSFDLVLCDSVMPNKPGEEIVGEIRRLSGSMPIITMSGRPPEHPDDTRAVRHLAKPFRARTLLSVVAECLATRGGSG
ncbi:MAG TPA: response regulator [Methylomirabilota bacterium]|nr:response regulator [Methylomirabilota bacterium]